MRNFRISTKYAVSPLKPGVEQYVKALYVVNEGPSKSARADRTSGVGHTEALIILQREQ